MTPHGDLTTFVSSQTGIDTRRGGTERSLARFAERRAGELDLSLGNYLSLLRTDAAELEQLVNAITVGYTWFFRDGGQLAMVEAMLGGDLARGRPVRVWVPGCSTGEDAYSLALLAARSRREVSILGTDVNSVSLEQARLGRYAPFALRELDPGAARFFSPHPDGSFELSREVRDRVAFARHNLLDRPPAHHATARWDVIVCRNVLIYFTRDAALRVIEVLASALAPGGYLVLGASEVVFDAPPGLEARYLAKRLAFHRPAEGAATDRAPPSFDWLMPRAAERSRHGFVSAFPFAASGETPALRAPTASSTLEAVESDGDDLSPGHALLDRGDARGARDVYVAAIKRDGARADAHMYAGVARYLCGEVDPAMRDLRAALFLDENLWPAAFYLALCHENSGHPEEAVLAYRHVVRLEERGARALGSIFDPWRADLSEVARKRVATSRLELVTR